MSVLLTIIRARCQAQLRDTDSRRNWFTTPDYDQKIAEAFISVSAQLPYPYLLTNNAFTISAGADTFDLPSNEYGGDTRLQLVSNGMFLFQRQVEEIDAMRQGNAANFQATPTDFALWEQADKSVKGRCYPRASSAEVVNLFVSLTADDLRAVNLDAVSVDLSSVAAAALVNLVSSELVESCTPEKLQERDFNPNVTRGWRQDAARMLWKDAARRHNLMAAGHIQRWVS